MGPTASGKTELAEELAAQYHAQLINADAFQVYRGMNIGTGKPERKELYRLIDLVGPNQDFGVGEWTRLAAEELEHLWEERRSAVVVGGTGLYIRALMEEYADMAARPNNELRSELVEEEQREGAAHQRKRLLQLDPEAAEKVDMANPIRVRRALEKLLAPAAPIPVSLPPFKKVKLALLGRVEELEVRIRGRIDRMFEDGWKEEVADLLKKGYTPEMPGFRAIGYRQVAELVRGKIGEKEAKEAISLATRRYAKRQRTWLRKEPNLRYFLDQASALDAPIL